MNKPNFMDYPTHDKYIYKTHDGRTGKDETKIKEKGRQMQIRQSSTRDLGTTLKRVQSKRLTQRGTKRINDLNLSKESLKWLNNYKNLSNSKQIPIMKENFSNISPRLKYKKSSEKKINNSNSRYFPAEISKPQDTGLMIDSVFSKSYGPTNSNLISNYQAALNELKMKWKKSNNSSSRGRKSGIKLNPNVKIQNHQATMWNSNTSRKTPIHNTKFVQLKQLKEINRKVGDLE